MTTPAFRFAAGHCAVRRAAAVLSLLMSLGLTLAQGALADAGYDAAVTAQATAAAPMLARGAEAGRPA